MAGIGTWWHSRSTPEKAAIFGAVAIGGYYLLTRVTGSSSTLANPNGVAAGLPALNGSGTGVLPTTGGGFNNNPPPPPTGPAAGSANWVAALLAGWTAGGEDTTTTLGQEAYAIYNAEINRTNPNYVSSQSGAFTVKANPDGSVSFLAGTPIDPPNLTTYGGNAGSIPAAITPAATQSGAGGQAAGRQAPTSAAFHAASTLATAQQMAAQQHWATAPVSPGRMG